MMACDAEDSPEIQAEEFAVANDVPDELMDEVLDFPEPGEEHVGDAERPLSFVSPGDPQAFSFLAPHSEETPGTSECPVGQVVTGFACTGSYCDNVQIECHDYGGSVPAASNAFSGWFEVGSSPGFASGVPNKQFHICGANEKMTGIDCRGSYCDDIRIECSPTTGLGTGRCRWTGEYSEEHSSYLAPIGQAIQGVYCSGQHCDNKSYFVCEV